MALRGGFAGFGQADPNARDIAVYETVLSGDLGGNDVDVNDPCDLVDEPTRAENCYHVTTADGTNETAVIEGFTIRNGYAFYTRSHPQWQRSQNRGGGMYNDGGSPVLIACTFYQNLAEEAGGGMYNNTDANPQLIRCTFSENIVLMHSGGGMYVETGHPLVTGCLFVRNIASKGGGVYNGANTSVIKSCAFIENYVHSYGGGIFNINIDTDNCRILNCTFRKNHASGGGGLMNRYGSNAQVKDCEFISNTASYYGGAIMNEQYITPWIVNCIIRENEAREGGGIYSYQSAPIIENCVLSGNVAWEIGGAISQDYVEEPHHVKNCTFAGNAAPLGQAVAFDSYQNEYRLINCIIRDKGESNKLWHDADHEAIMVIYTDIKGGWPGKGNIDVDPCFVDPGYWDPNGTPEDANDDFWVDGDYHLKSQATRWDPASQSWVQDGVTSPCIDAGDPIASIGPELFPNGGIINMGAYGGTVEASKSYFHAPTCETIIAGDINGDCMVDFRDFVILALHWLKQPDQ